LHEETWSPVSGWASPPGGITEDIEISTKAVLPLIKQATMQVAAAIFATRMPAEDGKEKAVEAEVAIRAVVAC
jgi:hypothetical protein